VSVVSWVKEERGAEDDRAAKREDLLLALSPRKSNCIFEDVHLFEISRQSG
jgi:hypothetical protein